MVIPYGDEFDAHVVHDALPSDVPDGPAWWAVLVSGGGRYVVHATSREHARQNAELASGCVVWLIDGPHALQAAAQTATEGLQAQWDARPLELPEGW